MSDNRTRSPDSTFNAAIARQPPVLAPSCQVVAEADQRDSRATLSALAGRRIVADLGATLRGLNLQFLRNSKSRTS